MKSKKIVSVLVGASAAFSASTVFAAAVTPGDLVVYQVGTGTGTLGSTATASFLDEYSLAGGPQVQQIAVPTADSGTQHALTNSGSATSEGSLSISADGKYIAFGGYDAAPGVTGVVASSASRVVGVLNTTTGAVDTSTALTDAYTINNIRGAYTDGTNIYTAGTSSTNGGIHYTTIGSTTSTIITNSTGTAGNNNGNTRTVQVYNGQLYASATSSTVFYGVTAIGTGTPTTAGQTATQLGVDSATTGASPYSFAFASLGGTTNPDTVYVADSGLGIQKYSLVGGTYTLTGTVALSGVTGISELTVGNVADLYAVTPGALYSLVDSSGFNGTLTGTPVSLETAGTNTAFRGVAYVPATSAVPEPASLSVLALLGMVARRRKA